MKTTNFFNPLTTLLFLVCLTTVWACNCDGDTLINNEWVLTAYGPEDATIPALDPTAVTPPGNGKITMRFEDNRITGRDGCNTYFGVFSQENCNFSADSINTTLILCQPEVMNQANTFMNILQSATTFSTKNNQLRLCTEDDRILVFDKN